MRISDWSSDVCSSDLLALCGEFSQALLEPTEGTKIIASSHRDIGTKTQRTQLERRTDFLFEKSRDTVCAGTEIPCQSQVARSEEHTSELQSLMRISYAVFCLKKKNTNTHKTIQTTKQRS